MDQTTPLKPHMRLFSRLRDEARENKPYPMPENTEVPPAFYLDEGWFAKERAALFAKKPIMIGHRSMLAKAGDHFVHDHLGKPLLVVRGHDDEIRVFLNVCRHRGMRLVTEDGVRRKPSFVCPYHHWAYDLDGSLKNAPLADDAFKGVDLSCRSLKPVQSAVRHGFIWAQLDDAPEMDLDAYLGELNSDYEAFETEKQIFYEQSTTLKKANWKLIVEAFQDGYHVTRLHQKTVGPMFMDCRAAMDRVGVHLRAVVARAEFPEVFDAPPEAWNDRTHVSFAHFVFPNSILVFHPDYISHLALYPQAVDETAVVHTCLIPKAPETEKERGHWERAFNIIENGVFQAEDLFVCENIQKGMASGANETLLIGAQENGIAMFHDILRDEMGPFSPAS